MKIQIEGGEIVVDVQGRAVPYGVTVSGAGAKTIKLSADGGVSYIDAQLDFETTESVGVTVYGSLTHVKLTGDEFEVI